MERREVEVFAGKESVGHFDEWNVAYAGVGNHGAWAPVGCDYICVPDSPSESGQVSNS